MISNIVHNAMIGKRQLAVRWADRRDHDARPELGRRRAEYRFKPTRRLLEARPTRIARAKPARGAVVCARRDFSSVARHPHVRRWGMLSRGGHDHDDRRRGVWV